LLEAQVRDAVRMARLAEAPQSLESIALPALVESRRVPRAQQQARDW